LVNDVQENKLLVMQKVEGTEVHDVKEKMEFTVKQNFGNVEQEEEQYQEEQNKVLQAQEEQLQEKEKMLLQKKGDLIQREKFVQDRERELMEMDAQRKLNKELWLKEEDERRKREEEQQKEKKEAEQKKINEQERKKQEELKIREKEESRRANWEKDFEDEKFEVWIWEKRKNTERKKKMVDVEKRMLKVKNWKQDVQQREKELPIYQEQELERQGVFEAFMNGKDEELKKQQLHIHQKGEKLKNRECNLNKLEVETRLREKKEREHREQCEVAWKTRELILMEREQQIREKKRHMELREQEVLERETKLQKAGKLAEERVEEEVLLITDDGLQKQQLKQQDVDLLPPEPKPQSDEGLQQRQQYSVVLQRQPKPHCEGRKQQVKQHDVDQLPAERKPHHSSQSKLVNDEPAEIERRKNNLMFRGVKEGEGEHDKEVVTKLIKAMNLNIEPVHTFRVGRYIENRFRPMKVVFSCESDRNLVLTNNKKVRNLTDPSLWTKNIFITPDYTQLQREKQEMLLSDLDKKRESDPNGRYTIKGDKVVLLKNPKGKPHPHR